MNLYHVTGTSRLGRLGDWVWAKDRREAATKFLAKHNIKPQNITREK